MDVGLKDVIKAARDLGIDARMQPVPSLALGAVEVSLLDLTGAFASLRAGRTGLEPWGITAFGDEDQRYMHTAGPPVARSAQSLGSAHQPMVDMLRQVVEYGTGRGAAVGGFAAGKTGTSQNHRDAWFVGFTNSLVVGVWVGNDDNAPMRGVVGGTLPASIWRQFVREATPLLGTNETQVAAVTAPASKTSPEAKAACDAQACAARYSSFRASDCTYQPYSGERRVCEVGMPTTASVRSEQSTGSQAVTLANEATNARAQARCNIEVCARRYRSFNARDCSYQPHGGGPRQVCEVSGVDSATAQPKNRRPQRSVEDKRPRGWDSYGGNEARRWGRGYGWQW
jgi:membrane peptidoglycan carboxypeptidase